MRRVMHGVRRGRLSDYAVQLREKQKVRRIIRRTGEAIPKLLQEGRPQDRARRATNLLQMLERPAGQRGLSHWATAPHERSRASLVSHKSVTVNGQWVNIASYQVKAGRRGRGGRKVSRTTPDPGSDCSWLAQRGADRLGRSQC